MLSWPTSQSESSIHTVVVPGLGIRPTDPRRMHRHLWQPVIAFTAKFSIANPSPSLAEIDSRLLRPDSPR